MSEREKVKGHGIQLTFFQTTDPKLQDPLVVRERLSVESWLQTNKEYLVIVVVSKEDACIVIIPSLG